MDDNRFHVYSRDNHTAALLPNGKVLVVTVESGTLGYGSHVQRFYSTRGLPKRWFRVEEESP